MTEILNGDKGIVQTDARVQRLTDINGEIESVRQSIDNSKPRGFFRDLIDWKIPYIRMVESWVRHIDLQTLAIERANIEIAMTDKEGQNV